MGLTMTATNHDDQLGEIYPTMLQELNCTFHVSFSRFRQGRSDGGYMGIYTPKKISPSRLFMG